MDTNSEPTEVSEEISKILEERFSEAKKAEKDAESKGFTQCTWHGNCYYCRDNRGRWRIMFCHA